MPKDSSETWHWDWRLGHWCESCCHCPPPAPDAVMASPLTTLIRELTGAKYSVRQLINVVLMTTGRQEALLLCLLSRRGHLHAERLSHFFWGGGRGGQLGNSGVKALTLAESTRRRDQCR